MSRHQSSRAKRFRHHPSVIGGRLRRRPIIKRFGYGPGLEVLENRTLLSVSATVSGSDVKFSGSSSDNVYLRTDSSQVEWSTNGTTWSSTDSSGHSFPKVAAGASNTFTFDMSGGVFVEGFTGAGGGLTFQGDGSGNNGFTGPKDLTIEGNISTQGGALTINFVQGIDVGSGLFVTTRHISAADLTASNFTGNSIGNSGALTLTVSNTDPDNPLLYVNFSNPHIEIDSNASILADANSGFAGGDVQMGVSNINYSLETQLFTLFQDLTREAQITVDSGATIKGQTVTLDANAGDLNPLLQIQSSKFSADAAQGLETFLDTALQILDPLSLPLSVVLRDATAKVTIGNNASISAVGKVDLESDAEADAEANAQFVSNSRIEVSIGFSWAQTDAETVVNPGATITAGGDVIVKSTGNSLASSSAETLTKAGGSSANAVQISGTIGVSKATSHATVSQTAKITSSNGNINVTAAGGNNNNNSTKIKSNSTGTAGIAFSVGDSSTDIVAEVDGTLSAVRPRLARYRQSTPSRRSIGASPIRSSTSTRRPISPMAKTSITRAARTEQFPVSRAARITTSSTCPVSPTKFNWPLPIRMP